MEILAIIIWMISIIMLAISLRLMKDGDSMSAIYFILVAIYIGGVA